MKEYSYERARAVLEAYLENGNFRKTQERFMLLELIYSSSSYVSVDELRKFLEKKNFRISRATIYNVLSILLRLNLVEKLMNSGRVLYGRNRESDFVELECRNCGKRVRVPLGPLAKDIDKIEETSGFVEVGRKLLLKGLCSACNKSLNLRKI